MRITPFVYSLLLAGVTALRGAGAEMECVWLSHYAPAAGEVVPVAECARAVKAVGAEHFILTSDFGQAANPVHTVGLRAFIAALMADGVSQREIDLMVRTNPARLLGLEK